MSKRIHNYHTENANDLKPIIQDPIKHEHIKNARKYYQLMKKEQRFMRDTALREGFDLDPHRAERRIEAAVDAIDDMLSVLKSAGLEPLEWTDQEWIKANLQPLIGCDSLEEEQNTILAAAIWILDRLMENGRYQDAAALFPKEELIGDEKMPAIQDLIHSEYAIRSMRWIIRHRNDDCIGLRKVDASKIPRYYMDEYTTRRQHHQDVPSRHRFETILGMISEHEIEQSIERYQEVHNDILLRFYQSRIIFAEEENRLREMGAANLEGVYTIVKDGLSWGNQAFKNSSDAIMTNSLQPARLDMSQAQLLAKQAYDRECVRREKLDRLGQRCAKLYDAIGFFHTWSKTHREDSFSPEVTAKWDDMAIHYPYDLCFAYLYLLDSDSPLPWVSAISTTLMKFCATALPWYDEPVFYDIGTPTGIGNKMTTADSKSASHYGTYFADSYISNADVSKNLNMAQIIYQMTGYLLPRRGYMNPADIGFLDRFGLNGSGFYDHVMNLLMPINAMRNRTYIAPVSEEPIQKEMHNVDDLQRRIRELELERKQLRQQLHEAEGNARRSHDELSLLRNSYEKDRHELGELRSLIFQEQSDEYSEEADHTISFPYRTNKKIVVVGGSDSWRNEMRKRFPDVCFVKVDSQPDPRMLRNADEIWFQSYYLSHSLYDTVKNHVVSYPVKLRYFHAKGAVKCAEELVQQSA